MSPMRTSKIPHIPVSTPAYLSNSPRGSPIRSIGTPRHKANATDYSKSPMVYQNFDNKYSEYEINLIYTHFTKLLYIVKLLYDNVYCIH